ncbi:MAG TPA: TIGR03773 family transporter-associated surface protein [Iamia sp.]|nr:TIGR03773 family transporter-associated surface protein [Iamia sp.]
MTPPRLARRPAAALVVLLVGWAVVTGSASGAEARRVLAVEHSDALHITYTGGALGLEARIGNAPDHTYADPADLIYQVVDSADTRLTVPADPRYAFLGAPGARTWVAPQVQHPGVVWPGWDTEDIPAGVLAGDAVTIALTDVTGPGPVEVFQTETAGPRRIFSSGDPAMTLRQPVGAHVHASWAFGALGTYTLTFAVTARPAGSGVTITTGPVAYTFVVGPLPPATTTTTTTGPAPTPSSSSTTTSPPGSSSTAPAPTTTSTTTTTAPPTGTCTGLEAVLDSGHVDIAARLVDGRLRTQLKDTTRGPTPVYWRDLEAVGLHVTDEALAQVPAGGAYGFLGAPGDRIWLLPQTQQAGVLWPGWNTEAIDDGQVSGPVTWSLEAVEGPGSLAVYELGPLGDVRVVFDSDDPLPQSRDLAVATHAHGSWVFDEPGIYHLTFNHRATARDGRTLASAGTIPVAVGPVDLAGLCPGGEVPPPGGGGGGGVVDASGSGPGTVTGGGGTAVPAGDTAGPAARACAPVSLPAPTAAPTAPAAAAPVVLDDGHVDYAVRLEDGALRSRIKDGTVAGTTEWRDPAGTVLHLTSAGATEVPDAGFAFLGAPGTPIWQIPQTQQAGLLWLGWNTEELSAAEVRGDVTWTLDAVDGPGEMAVFEYDAFGAPQVIFTSRDGVGDSHRIALGTHAHGNWAFTAPGAYRVTFTHTATLASGATVSDTRTVRIAVGDTDPAALVPAGGPPAAGPPSAPVVVTGADGCPRIARTGTELAVPTRIAALLLAAGALAVAATRRRRQAAA